MEGKKEKGCLSPFMKQLFVVSGSVMSVTSHGCAIGHPAVMLPQMKNGPNEIHVNNEVASWIASTLGLGIVLGNFISPFTMEKYGRKISHQLCTLPILVGWLMIALSQDVTTIIIGRILQGMSIGMQSPVSPIAIAENTSPKSRGAFLGAISMSLAAGMFLTHLIGTYLHWRTTAFICAAPMVTALIVFTLSPETPNWLASKGKLDEAKQSFYWLRGDDKKSVAELDMLLNAKLTEMKIKEKVQLQTTTRTPFTKKIREIVSLLMTRRMYIPSLIMFNMCIMFQFSGNNIIPSYTVEIVEAIMHGEANPYTIMLIIDIARFISAIFGIYLVRRMKRRLLLFTSGILTVVSLISVAICLHLEFKEIVRLPTTWIPIILLIISVCIMTLGIIPLPWALSGEVFPLAHKSLGGGIFGIGLSSCLFASVKTAPATFAAIGIDGAFGVYAVIVTFCLVNLYFILPETKGKTLQEIDVHFNKSKLEETEMAVCERTEMLKNNTTHVDTIS